MEENTNLFNDTINSTHHKFSKILYHGSNVIVSEPRVFESGFYKDFGFGFYCTEILDQAKRWAISRTAKLRQGSPCISKFSYSINPHSESNILTFEKATEEWLDFVVNCRRGIPHNYDIVEGPMADDRIWDYIDALLSNTISREDFWILAKFKYKTHQVCFCNNTSINRHLKYLNFINC